MYTLSRKYLLRFTKIKLKTNVFFAIVTNLSLFHILIRTPWFSILIHRNFRLSSLSDTCMQVFQWKEEFHNAG